jgi:hypothetical protein
LENYHLLQTVDSETLTNTGEIEKFTRITDKEKKEKYYFHKILLFLIMFRNSRGLFKKEKTYKERKYKGEVINRFVD